VASIAIMIRNIIAFFFAFVLAVYLMILALDYAKPEWLAYLYQAVKPMMSETLIDTFKVAKLYSTSLFKLGHAGYLVLLSVLKALHEVLEAYCEILEEVSKFFIELMQFVEDCVRYVRNSQKKFVPTDPVVRFFENTWHDLTHQDICKRVYFFTSLDSLFGVNTALKMREAFAAFCPRLCSIYWVLFTSLWFVWYVLLAAYGMLCGTMTPAPAVQPLVAPAAPAPAVQPPVAPAVPAPDVQAADVQAADVQAPDVQAPVLPPAPSVRWICFLWLIRTLAKILFWLMRNLANILFYLALNLVFIFVMFCMHMNTLQRIRNISVRVASNDTLSYVAVARFGEDVRCEDLLYKWLVVHFGLWSNTPSEEEFIIRVV
jgi:hypothetical protein